MQTSFGEPLGNPCPRPDPSTSQGSTGRDDVVGGATEMCAYWRSATSATETAAFRSGAGLAVVTVNPRIDAMRELFQIYK